jgi:phosphatidylglycerol:prolipoprotein diacylglycerol transferase
LLSKALSPLRKRQFKGMGASIYLLTYPVFRFIIEFFRGDPRGSVGPFSTSQFIGLFAFSAGVFLFFYMKNKR